MGMYILVGILALVAGVALGFFIARRYMMSYLKKNPPINEQMLKMMMMQMGIKPSQKKINQMMAAMNKTNKINGQALIDMGAFSLFLTTFLRSFAQKFSVFLLL